MAGPRTGRRAPGYAGSSHAGIAPLLRSYLLLRTCWPVRAWQVGWVSVPISVGWTRTFLVPGVSALGQHNPLEGTKQA